MLEKLIHEAGIRRRQYLRPNTRLNIIRHFKLYLCFCMFFGLNTAPLTPTLLCAFIEFLANSYNCPATIRNIVSSVSTVYGWMGWSQAPFRSYLILQMLHALDRTLRYEPRVLYTVTVSDLALLVSSCSILGLNTVMFRAFLTILFYTMVRISSLIPQNSKYFDLTRHTSIADLERTSSGYIFKLKWAKNLQKNSEGFSLPLLFSSNPAVCPVVALDLDYSNYRQPLFQFRQNFTTAVALDIAQANLLLSQLLVANPMLSSKITFHGFRRGAVTSAFDSGSSVLDIGSFGGWKSSALLQYLGKKICQIESGQSTFKTHLN